MWLQPWPRSWLWKLPQTGLPVLSLPLALPLALALAPCLPH